ncbi:MAG: hypothetical protein HY302_11760 [Opitutae bacterium]|nr:hypothetical protein [Opitutae bacterium]
MKTLSQLLLCLLLGWTPGHAADEVLRIKLEWLNAKDCGFEGCKPQNVVMKEGTTMGFGWPELRDRGFFELAPNLKGDTANLKIKRMLRNERKSMETIAAVEPELRLGKPQDVVLRDFSLRITITEEPASPKK